MKKLKASEVFVAGKNQIYWVGASFKEHFYGMTFTAAKDANLQTKTFKGYMFDKEILQEFKPQAVSLGDVLAYLSVADKIDWYIFYVNDAKGTLWAVDAVWRSGGGGWGVEARSVGGPVGWDGGFQVVSREFTKTLESTQSLYTSDTLPLTLEINGFTYKRV